MQSTRILTSNLYYYINNNNYTRVRLVIKYVCIGNYTRNNILYTHNIPAMPVTSVTPVFKNGQQNNNIDFFRPVSPWSRRHAVKRVETGGYI